MFLFLFSYFPLFCNPHLPDMWWSFPPQQVSRSEHSSHQSAPILRSCVYTHKHTRRCLVWLQVTYIALCDSGWCCDFQHSLLSLCFVCLSRFLLLLTENNFLLSFFKHKMMNRPNSYLYIYLNQKRLNICLSVLSSFVESNRFYKTEPI